MSKPNIAGMIAIHKHEKDDWRIRDLEHHPNDPNWEKGTYSLCHKHVRKTIGEQWLFDAIWAGKPSTLYLRSAFKVTRKAGREDDFKLHFKKYYFNDEKDCQKLLKLTYKICRSLPDYKGPFPNRTGYEVFEDEFDNLIDLMKKSSFNEYDIGEKPESIAQEDWDEMSKAVKNYHERHDDHDCDDHC